MLGLMQIVQCVVVVVSCLGVFLDRLSHFQASQNIPWGDECDYYKGGLTFDL